MNISAIFLHLILVTEHIVRFQALPICKSWRNYNSSCEKLALKTPRKDVRLSLGEVQEHLAEQSIYPGKPRSSPVMYIVSVDRFMNKTQTVGRAKQVTKSVDNFLVVVGSHDSHNDGHWPDHARTLVRTTDGVEDRSVCVVWVGGAEDVLPSVLVSVAETGAVFVSKMGDTEQRRDVGVILDKVSEL